jgi:ABC-type multidrug transport system fused ATPase/permease subunit
VQVSANSKQLIARERDWKSNPFSLCSASRISSRTRNRRTVIAFSGNVIFAARNAPPEILMDEVIKAARKTPAGSSLRAITIRGAREHNLKNVDLEIPRDKLVVFTGLSGSGKSSLAFDTIYAEGQRRYVDRCQPTPASSLR